jgi:hypothetical protein
MKFTLPAVIFLAGYLAAHNSAARPEDEEDYAHLKKTCNEEDLKPVLDDYVAYTHDYYSAIFHLKKCRDFGTNGAAKYMRAELKRIRFKNSKPSNLQPYIDACKDDALRAVAKEVLADLALLRRHGANVPEARVPIADAARDLENILFQLDRHTKTENLEKLKRLKEDIKKWQLLAEKYRN